MSASITYIGNEDTPEAITAFGVSFVRNQPVDVSDALAIGKLSGNSHFIVVDHGDGVVRVMTIATEVSALPLMPEPKRRGKPAKVIDGG